MLRNAASGWPTPLTTTLAVLVERRRARVSNGTRSAWGRRPRPRRRASGSRPPWETWRNPSPGSRSDRTRSSRRPKRRPSRPEKQASAVGGKEVTGDRGPDAVSKTVLPSNASSGHMRPESVPHPRGERFPRGPRRGERPAHREGRACLPGQGGDGVDAAHRAADARTSPGSCRGSTAAAGERTPTCRVSRKAGEKLIPSLKWGWYDRRPGPSSVTYLVQFFVLLPPAHPRRHSTRRRSEASGSYAPRRT